jgi:hypothetical protein
MVDLDGRAKNEVEGTLTEDHDGLVFTGSSSSIIRFPFSDVAKVKRVMASPVFIVRSRSDRRETAFYLTRPPPLGVLGGQGRPDAGVPTMSSRFRGSGKWHQRRENTRYLAATSTNLRDLRDAWVHRIRTAAKERGS